MIKENERIREQIWQSINKLTEEQLNRKITEGRWSIMQVLEHLYLMEKTITAGIKQALITDGAHPTDPKPYQLTLDRSRTVAAPPHLVPTETYIPLEDITAKLQASRHGLNQALEGTDELLWLNKSFPHPVFGLMDVRQWVDFIGFHEERHLAQIKEIIEQL